jgi:acetoin utilization deacetylase AcuC-like enzyme
MRHRLFVDPEHHLHVTGPGHPECPARIEACQRALENAGLADLGVEVAPPPPAPSADLERVHPARYLDRLEAHCRAGGGPLDQDTVAGPASFDVARRAAGACVAAVGLSLDSGTRSFCLVRPPGHHASAMRPMGFCLLNHAAVGAASAIGRGLSRVAVVDVDVHHGNGTQEIFWRDPNVLYVSLHQWPWYPWYAGGLEEIGEGDGEGANVNVPLQAGSGDAVYLAAMDRIVGPVVRAFAPELLLVSAGYDAHLRDPLSSMEVTTRGYARIAAGLVALAEEVCGGRIVMTLEGGYDLDALSSSFVETMRALSGEALASGEAGEGVGPAPEQDDPLDPSSAQALELERAVSFHARRWPTSGHDDSGRSQDRSPPSPSRPERP